MKTIVVMEVGNNWETEKDILDSIDFGRSRGCLIKLQAHQGEFEHLRDYIIPMPLMKKIAAPDVFYSVFSSDMVNWLETNVNPAIYKLASRSCKDEYLIQKVASTKKKVIQSIPEWCDYFNPIKYDFSYLHCVAVYPAKSAHLSRLNSGMFDGFSDHTMNPMVPALAVAMGAKIIEHHFKIREMKTPDSGHSYLPKEWDEMLENIRLAEMNL